MHSFYSMHRDISNTSDGLAHSRQTHGGLPGTVRERQRKLRWCWLCCYMDYSRLKRKLPRCWKDWWPGRSVICLVLLGEPSRPLRKRWKRDGRTVCLGEVLATWWRTICHRQSSLNWAQSCTTRSMRTSPDLNGSAGQSQEETWLKICMKWNEMQILHSFAFIPSSKMQDNRHNLTKKESPVYKIRSTIRNI